MGSLLQFVILLVQVEVEVGSISNTYIWSTAPDSTYSRQVAQVV